MKRLIFPITCIILLFSSLFLFKKDSSFSTNFWSNLISDSIIAILFGIILIRFTIIFNKPKLLMAPYQDGLYGEKIIAKKQKDGNFIFKFRVAIKNEGDKTFKSGEGYWHIYFIGPYKVDFIGHVDYPDKNFSHIRDMINFPVFPKSFLDINVDFVATTTNKDIKNGKCELYHFFSTDYGNFPKSAIINPKTGFVEYKNMNKIPIILSESDNI